MTFALCEPGKSVQPRDAFAPALKRQQQNVDAQRRRKVLKSVAAQPMPRFVDLPVIGLDHLGDGVGHSEHEYRPAVRIARAV
jgi:hypothetical protein